MTWLIVVFGLFASVFGAHEFTQGVKGRNWGRAIAGGFFVFVYFGGLTAMAVTALFRWLE